MFFAFNTIPDVSSKVTGKHLMAAAGFEGLAAPTRYGIPDSYRGIYVKPIEKGDAMREGGSKVERELDDDDGFGIPKLRWTSTKVSEEHFFHKYRKVR